MPYCWLLLRVGFIITSLHHLQIRCEACISHLGSLSSHQREINISELAVQPSHLRFKCRCGAEGPGLVVNLAVLGLLDDLKDLFQAKLFYDSMLS